MINIFSKNGRLAFVAAWSFIGLAGISNTCVATPLLSAFAAPERGASSGATDMPDSAKLDSGLAGTLNPGVLSAATVELTLADGTQIQARLQRTAVDDRNGVRSWVGTFEDSPGSVLVLTRAKGVVTGFATYKERILELRPAAGGKHLLFEVDGKRLPQTDGVNANTGAHGGDVPTTTNGYGAGDTTLAAGNVVVHDVLVMYTAAAATKWGQATLESMIRSAVQSANQAYLNSFANVTLNLVGLQQSRVTEGSGMVATLDKFSKDTTVRSLRDNLSADMVMLVTQNTDWCGYATLWYSYSGSTTNWDAYAAINSGCLSNNTLAHEFGHLQQLDHNRENATGLAAYPYSYGYRRCTTGGFIDIMSYPCSGMPRIAQFSNPDVTYNGYPTGVAYEADPSHSADTARTLNGTATLVASYRVSSSPGSTTVPSAPSGMTIQSVAYNYVNVGWIDNSTNETGFKLQRSTDGVNFTEIASLGAGALSFKDASVVARTNYYYRVRAYNSAGASSYSNTASVTTPAASLFTPAAPSAISAVNNADGSALVSWTDASSNETGFEVGRKKWDPTFQVWSGWKKVGSVPTGTTRFLDLAGNGTFRYYVRAVNSAGGSKYTGPAELTITGG